MINYIVVMETFQKFGAFGKLRLISFPYFKTLIPSTLQAKRKRFSKLPGNIRW